MPVYLPLTSIARAAADAGWTGEALVTAVAITRCEARAPDGQVQLDARCHDCKDDEAGNPIREDSNGPWQVNVDAHPQYNAARLRTDLRYSAEAAHAIWRDAGGFRPWSCYKHGDYAAHLDEARTAVAKLGTTGQDSDDGGGIVGAIGDALSKLPPWLNPGGRVIGEAASNADQIVDAIEAFKDPRTWLQVGLVIAFTAAGLWLVVTGVKLVAVATPNTISQEA